MTLTGDDGHISDLPFIYMTGLESLLYARYRPGLEALLTLLFLASKSLPPLFPNTSVLLIPALSFNDSGLGPRAQAVPCAGSSPPPPPYTHTLSLEKFSKVQLKYQILQDTFLSPPGSSSHLLSCCLRHNSIALLQGLSLFLA